MTRAHKERRKTVDDLVGMEESGVGSGKGHDMERLSQENAIRK